MSKAPPPPVEPTRIFVVGCPRSGTTLLQSMLAAHPDVLAFPETHVLWGLESSNPLVRRAGLRSRHGAETWATLPRLGVPVAGSAPRRVGAYVRGAATGLDEAARRAGRAAWSEKTPGHLRSLPLVARYVPRAHVVHVVRQGLQTVTSLYAVTQEHGPAWDGRRSVELCLTRWQNDLRRTASWASHPRHHVLAYEDLVQQPERLCAGLVRVLELSGEPDAEGRSMARSYQGYAARMTSPGEMWKAGVAGGLVDRTAVHERLLDGRETDAVRHGVRQLEDVYAGLPFLFR